MKEECRRGAGEVKKKWKEETAETEGGEGGDAQKNISQQERA